MSITLHLSPELEGRLAAEAERLARPLEVVALRAIEDSLGAESSTSPTSREEWQQELHSWIASHQPISHVVDDSRASIYGDDR
jgi:predicted transcriptional regulator